MYVPWHCFTHNVPPYCSCPCNCFRTCHGLIIFIVTLCLVLMGLLQPFACWVISHMETCNSRAAWTSNHSDLKATLIALLESVASLTNITDQQILPIADKDVNVFINVNPLHHRMLHYKQFKTWGCLYCMLFASHQYLSHAKRAQELNKEVTTFNFILFKYTYKDGYLL